MIAVEVNPVHEAVKEGRAAYLAAHPEPSTLDFRCPRCKTEPGQLCPGRPLGHAPRQDRMIYAHNMWNLDATNHGINVENERAGDPYRHKTDHHLAYMRRNKARIRQPGEPATTVTFGAWLLAHTPRAAPLSYLGIRPLIRSEMSVDDVSQLLEEGDWVAGGVLAQAARDWAALTGTHS